jgi:hypothetical protein
MLAPGATPSVWPATVPATWVPWPWQSRVPWPSLTALKPLFSRVPNWLWALTPVSTT